jgi:hypothetical protein
MKNINTVLLLVGLLVSTGAYATNWIDIGDNSLSILNIDTQSIVKNGKFKKAWIKINYSENQEKELFSPNGYNQMKSLWYFDCKAQTISATQSILYLDDTDVNTSIVDISKAIFREPAPESYGETAMKFVCKNK